MKKILSILMVSGMLAFVVACGPTAAEKAEKATADSIAMADSIAKVQFIADSTATADSIAKALVADSIAKATPVKK